MTSTRTFTSRPLPEPDQRYYGGSSVRFRYAANTRLREACMWWAFNSLKVSPWANEAFRHARDRRGQRYHRALRGVSARWARVLWRCWTDGTTYDPQRHRTAAAARELTTA